MNNLNFDAHFQDLFDNTSDLIHFVSIAGSILKVNPALARNLGYRADELIGKSIHDIIHEDSHERFMNYRNQIIARKEVKEIEVELVGKTGDRIIVEGQIGCVYQHGTPIYTRGVFKNITLKKTTEMALAKNQARLAAFLKSAPSAVIIIDQQQAVQEWNAKAEAIFGYLANDVLGRPLADMIIPVQYREAHANGMARFLATGEGRVLDKTIEISALHKNGHEFPVSLNISSVKIEGQLLFIAFISDITDYKLLQEQVIKKEAALLQSKILDDKKDEFLSMASHELKTPLTSLKAYVQLMERSVVSNSKIPVEIPVKASNYIRKLENLISDLLDVSKIKADKIIYNLEEFSFPEFLIEAVESVQHIAYSHRIKIIESTKAICLGDKIRIEQVIQNLISNAIKFSPDSSQVEIGARRNANMLEIFVRDTGIGVGKDDLKKLFGRFYRVEGAEMKFPGLGIGLYISHEIVQRHHGRLWVESELGEGSTFYFSLPVSEN
jgi:two-component system sensor kinase FixL